MELSLKSLILTSAMLTALDSNCMEIIDRIDSNNNRIEETYDMQVLMEGILSANADALANQGDGNLLMFETSSTEVLSALENLILMQKQTVKALDDYIVAARGANVGTVHTDLLHKSDKLKKCYEKSRVPLCVKAIIFSALLKELCSQSINLSSEILGKTREIEITILPLQRNAALHAVDFHYKNVIDLLVNLSIMYKQKMLDNAKELAKVSPDFFIDIPIGESANHD